ncbi:MAG: type II toxin-antitoxin system VapC family toxin [Dehalococcoidia bacterium]|nr:type II toxin-antitoxin system VapC family toxin [Dehalococcoidia bacterium]
MIVADTNLLVYAMTYGPHRELAQSVLRKDPEWHAPTLWRSEFRSALAGYLRAEAMSYEEILEAIDKTEFFMAGKEHSVDSTAVMRLVADSTSSAYDCEFVALANHLNAPLVTSDSRLLRDFPNRAFAPDRFLAA